MKAYFVLVLAGDIPRELVRLLLVAGLESWHRRTHLLQKRAATFHLDLIARNNEVFCTSLKCDGGQSLCVLNC